MDRFSALKAFTRVVEAGSFTRAADSLNMPNATLSKTIQQLEAHLGVSLLQRTTRRITVTPEGREYYEKARCLLEDLEEIDASFNTARNKPKGHLRIAIGGSTACDVLIPLLADFMTSWPDIRIDLQVADKPADLISGNIDCAIRGGPMEDSTLIARKIGEATLVTCATPGYLQRYGTPASPDELHHGHSAHQLSVADQRQSVSVSLYASRRQHRAEDRAPSRINESNAHIAAGEAGLGIVQTFTYSLKPALASGELVEISAPGARPPYPFHVVYARHRHVPPGSASLLTGWRRFFRPRCRVSARYLTRSRSPYRVGVARREHLSLHLPLLLDSPGRQNRDAPLPFFAFSWSRTCISLALLCRGAKLVEQIQLGDALAVEMREHHAGL